MIPATAAAAAETRTPSGEVALPLREYLALVEAGEAAAKSAAERLARREPPLAEITAQTVQVTVADGEARIATRLEVLVRGEAIAPVALPVTGFAESIRVQSVAAASGGTSPATAAASGVGGVTLVAPAAGRYVVDIVSRARGDRQGGIWRLPFPAVTAPVATLELDLPLAEGWSCSHAVTVSEEEKAPRRRAVLAPRRGAAPVLELRRQVESAAAEELLAQAVVLTLVELRPEGARRHDVVLYEVARGALDRFAVRLPAGLEATDSATDEGRAVPTMEDTAEVVHRQRGLRGTGYLVLSSAPGALDGGGGAPLEAVLPEVPVRARYLALATAVAAEVAPLPAEGWLRVDLDDLPALLREALSAIDLVAAWRLTGEGAALSLRVATLPPVPAREAAVRRRETTTLLTVDGTVLHRDLLVLDPAGPALDLVLPAGSTLWSVRVDGEPVVPLERAGGLTVPLGFATSGGETRVEVVSVVERAIPPGRSQLALELPQVAIPVLDQRWQLLLPEGNRYRFRHGDLRPAPGRPGVVVGELSGIPTASDPWSILQATPGAMTDAINVGGRESGQTSADPGGSGAGVAGVVRDDHGLSLPGVTVTIAGVGAPRVAVTDSAGQFRFPGLEPGTYQVSAELEGFSSIEYPQVQTRAGRVTTLALTLSAAVEETITVTAESPLLDARKLSAGTTVSLSDGGRGFDLGSKKKSEERDEALRDADNRANYALQVANLKQGLVGGVRPLPVVIPESGKSLLLTGVLPPARVAVELEVRAKG